MDPSWCPECHIPMAQPEFHDQTTSNAIICLRLTPLLPPTLVAGLDPLLHGSWYYDCPPNTPPVYVCLILTTIGTTAGQASTVPGAASFCWAKPPTGQNWGSNFVRSVQLPNLLGRPVMRADGMIAGQVLGFIFQTNRLTRETGGKSGTGRRPHDWRWSQCSTVLASTVDCLNKMDKRLWTADCKILQDIARYCKVRVAVVETDPERCCEGLGRDGGWTWDDLSHRSHWCCFCCFWRFFARLSGTTPSRSLGLSILLTTRFTNPVVLPCFAIFGESSIFKLDIFALRELAEVLQTEAALNPSRNREKMALCTVWHFCQFAIPFWFADQRSLLRRRSRLCLRSMASLEWTYLCRPSLFPCEFGLYNTQCNPSFAEIKSCSINGGHFSAELAWLAVGLCGRLPRSLLRSIQSFPLCHSTVSLHCRAIRMSLLQANDAWTNYSSPFHLFLLALRLILETGSLIWYRSLKAIWSQHWFKECLVRQRFQLMFLFYKLYFSYIFMPFIWLSGYTPSSWGFWVL